VTVTPTSTEISTDSTENHTENHTDPHTMELLRTMAGDPNPRARARAREELIEQQRPFADFLARRFRNRGEPLEDLCQVAAIGLIKAIDGFDVERGSSFAGYAIPTILGELRRHFRDKGWNVRVPRRLQELRTQIAAVTEPLTQELGRAPTTHDLAEALGLTEDEIREGLAAAQAYSATSLQTPVHREDDGPTLADLVAHEDGGYEVVEARESLRTLLGSLPERERRILGLRFYSQLTQSEIAAELGISQMHVSRLLSRSLGSLRDQLQPAI
jgi:RNA polymerase sigma-B factor